MQALPKIVAVVGTNASGKSGLGVALARRFGGEIVSADSRQVYRGLDLGSGKITPEEMGIIRHHLIDICEPNDFFSMADFQKAAYRAIDDILSRGRLPILVGGTGLYVACVLDGYVLSDVAPDLAYREELETYATDELYRMLLARVPDARVDERNRNRVMRMLERLHSGDTRSDRREKRYEALRLGVTWPRDELGARIDERLDRRMRAGMVDEVRMLIKNGANIEFLMKLGLEYRFITRYLTGEIQTEQEMTQGLRVAIRQFAKRQMTWFRRDADIRWLNMKDDPQSEAEKMIEAFLS